MLPSPWIDPTKVGTGVHQILIGGQDTQYNVWHVVRLSHSGLNEQLAAFDPEPETTRGKPTPFLDSSLDERGGERPRDADSDYGNWVTAGLNARPPAQRGWRVGGGLPLTVHGFQNKLTLDVAPASSTWFPYPCQTFYF